MLGQWTGEQAVVGGHEAIPDSGIAPKQVISSDGNLGSFHGNVLTTGRICFVEVKTFLASPFQMNAFLVKWGKRISLHCTLHRFYAFLFLLSYPNNKA